MPTLQSTRHGAAKKSPAGPASPGPEIHPFRLWKWPLLPAATRFKSPYRPPTVKTARGDCSPVSRVRWRFRTRDHLLPHRLRLLIALPPPLAGGRTLARAPHTGAGASQNPETPLTHQMGCVPPCCLLLPNCQDRTDRSSLAGMRLSVPGASGRAPSTKRDFRCSYLVRPPSPRRVAFRCRTRFPAAPALTASTRNLYRQPDVDAQ